MQVISVLSDRSIQYKNKLRAVVSQLNLHIIYTTLGQKVLLKLCA